MGYGVNSGEMKPKIEIPIRMNCDLDNSIALRKVKRDLMEKNPGASYSLQKRANNAIRLGLKMNELNIK